MIKLFIISKKIHRFLVFIVVVLSLIMGFTGLLLKYTFLSSMFGFLDLRTVRYVHNQLSPWLAVVLFLMAGTGIFMYYFLWPKKPKNNPQ